MSASCIQAPRAFCEDDEEDPGPTNRELCARAFSVSVEQQVRLWHVETLIACRTMDQLAALLRAGLDLTRSDAVALQSNLLEQVIACITPPEPGEDLWPYFSELYPPSDSSSSSFSDMAAEHAVPLACAFGYQKALEFFSARGADLHRDYRNVMPMVATIIDASMTLADQPTRLDIIPTMAHTPLFLASLFDRAECVQYLLQQGVDVHAHNDVALRIAASQWHDGVVRVLLKAGADLTAEGHDSLLSAIRRGHVSVVRELIAAGADLSSLSERIWSEALETTFFLDHDMLEQLWRMGWRPPKHVERSFMHSCVQHEAIDALRLVFLSGEKHLWSSIYESDVHDAVRSGRSEIVGALLEYMGIRFQPHMHGWLRVAVQNGHYDLVETLLDRGALVESALLNEAPLSPQSSLYQAARKNYHRTLRLLLERGCDVNEMAKHTLVPAMKYGHLDLIAMLFERGLRLNDAALWTLCLRLAVVKNQLNLLEQLLELGVPADAFDEHALLVAVARKRAATVNLLLQYERNKGIDVSVPILASRLKVISKAASRGYRDTLQLLVTHTCGGSEVRVLQVLHHAFEHAQSQHLGLYLTALLPMLSKSASDELLRAQVHRGVLSVVKALLQHGADVNAVSDDGLKACLASGNLPLWTLLKACQEDARSEQKDMPVKRKRSRDTGGDVAAAVTSSVSKRARADDVALPSPGAAQPSTSSSSAAGGAKATAQPLDAISPKSKQFDQLASPAFRTRRSKRSADVIS